MKLKVLDTEDTPKECKRRVVLNHSDAYHEWVRDAQDMTFILWSNVRGYSSDTVFNPVTGKRVEADSPFEDVYDEDGNETGEKKLKDGLIAFPVDMLDHSGLTWALHGEGGPGFYCQFDTTLSAFWLYVDEERWTKYCGNCAWEFVDGKPSEKLLEAARNIARAEIEEMNLHAHGYYYGYREEESTHEVVHAEITDCRGYKRERRYEHDTWETVDSCGGFLTRDPAQDVDFPIGCPVVTETKSLVGDTFEQECWALSDDATGKFVRIEGKNFVLTDNPEHASLWGSSRYPTANKKLYEDDCKRALTVVDVTERVWSGYPECHA